MVHRGSAFAVTPTGGLITCRHVVDVPLKTGDVLGVTDQTRGVWQGIDQASIAYPDDRLDLAFIPHALRRASGYIPLLPDSNTLTGTDVHTWGFYERSTDDGVELTSGFFRGAIINREAAGPTMPHGDISLPFPIVEGLSGAPIIDYHNGTKAVGIAYGSTSQRVQAFEDIHVTEDGREIIERTMRVVEFGRAFPASTIIAFLQAAGATDYLVTEGSVEGVPGLAP
jgi:hypothetical protein